MTSEPFKKALTFTLKYEGGYSNHPADRGGSTMRGITQATYNSYLKSHKKPYTLVRWITNEEVEDIYYNNYWLTAGCNTMPIKEAIAVFDFAVNSGVERALKYFKLVGGDLGMYLDQRQQYFRTIAKGTNRVFLNGWLHRIDALRYYLKTL